MISNQFSYIISGAHLSLVHILSNVKNDFTFFCILDYTNMDSEQPQDQLSTDTLSGTCTLIEI